jgi:hypothetical protein
MSMTPEEKRARRVEQKRQWQVANKEKEAERRRLRRVANKEKEVEQKRQWRVANKEKEAEQKSRYRLANKEKLIERNRRYSETNREKLIERMRRYNRRRSFAKEDGSSFQSWLAGLYNRSAVFESIANLTPDPGQTLTELIHELSGYAMEVCEQIANPPVIEDAQPAQPAPQPDLF